MVSGVSSVLTGSVYCIVVLDCSLLKGAYQFKSGLSHNIDTLYKQMYRIIYDFFEASDCIFQHL